MKRVGHLNNDFDISARANVLCYENILQQACNIATSSIEWTGLDSTIDTLFLEKTLMEKGSIVVFRDEYLGMVALPFFGENIDIYGVPRIRNAYSFEYKRTLTQDNSVIIYNNMYRTPTLPWLLECVYDLYNLLQTYRININVQKTPMVLECDEKQKLSVLNAYEQYAGNMPVMHFYKGLSECLRVLKTDAPYLIDKLHEAYSERWNDLMSYLGITSTTEMKRERLIKAEGQSMMAGALAHRQSRIVPREQAVKRINEMFGVNWEVHFNNLDGDDSLAEAPEEEGEENGSRNDQSTDNL